MEEIGLRAVFESDEFTNGIKVYMAGIAQADKVTGGFASTVLDKVSNAVNKAAPALMLLESLFGKNGNEAEKAANGVRSFSGVAQLAEGGISKLSLGSLALAEAIGNVLSNAFNKVVGSIENFVLSGIKSVSRVQEMDYVLANLGDRFGYTTSEIDEQIRQVKEYGIQTDTAQNLTQQFIRNQLDLSKAGQLARVAQDAAVISMASSSETLDRLLYGIQTYNTEVLRTAGLNVNMQIAFDTYAETLGKTSAALSTTERQQAVLNAILLEGEKNAGIYESAMEAPGKQLRSLERDIYELTLVMGEPFMDAYGDVIASLRDLATGFKTAISEGGVLYPLFINLGAIASILADKFRSIVETFFSFINVTKEAKTSTDGFAGSVSDIGNAVAPVYQEFYELVSWFDSTFGDLIDSATNWGVGFVTSFAQGIINGVGAVVDSLSYVAKVVTAWLQPGSPPKLLPDLDDWGKSAMEVYLEGWTNADFSIFKSLAGTISGILKSLSTGKDDRGLIPSILGSREAVAEAITEVNKLGQVTQATINKVVTASGIGTQAFKDYIEATLQSELAANKLQAAQDELSKITTYYDAELQKLNATLASGSEKVADDQKLKSIEASLATGLLTKAEKERLIAEKNDILTKRKIQSLQKEKELAVSSAQTKVDEAAKEYALLQQRAELAKMTLDLTVEQNELIKQQINLLDKLAKALEESAKAGRGGGLGGGLGGLEIPPKGAETEGGLGGKTPIEKAKEAIVKALDDLWSKITEPISKFFSDLSERIAQSGIVKSFSALGSTIFTIMKVTWTNITGIWNAIYDYFQQWWSKYGADVKRVWTVFNQIISTLVNFIWTWLTTIWTANSGVLYQLISNWLQSIQNIVQIVWDLIWLYIDTVLLLIGETFGTFSALFSGDWDDFLHHLSNIWGLIWNAMISTLAGIIQIILTLVVAWIATLILEFEGAKKTLVTLAEKTWSAVQKAIEGAIEAVGKYIAGLSGQIAIGLAQALLTIYTFVQDFHDAGKAIIMGMVAGIVANVISLINAVKGAVQDAIDGVNNLLQRKSPSKVFAAMGADMMMGMAVGVDSTSSVVNRALANTIGSASKLFGSAYGSSNYSTVNNNQQYYDVSVAPVYQNTQSSSSVYYDVRAALAATRA